MCFGHAASGDRGQQETDGSLLPLSDLSLGCLSRGPCHTQDESTILLLEFEGPCGGGQHGAALYAAACFRSLPLSCLQQSQSG